MPGGRVELGAVRRLPAAGRRRTSGRRSRSSPRPRRTAPTSRARSSPSPGVEDGVGSDDEAARQALDGVAATSSRRPGWTCSRRPSATRTGSTPARRRWTRSGSPTSWPPGRHPDGPARRHRDDRRAVHRPDRPGLRQGQHLHGAQGRVHEVQPGIPRGRGSRRTSGTRRRCSSAVHAAVKRDGGRPHRAGSAAWARRPRRADTLIFDCDGVLADTERYGHLPAFNQTFEEFGLPVRWSEEEYGQQAARSAAARSGWRSLLTPEFVAAAGLPADPAGPGRAAGRLAPAQDRDLHRRWSPAGKLPGRPGIAPDHRRRRSTPAGGSRSPRPRRKRRCGPCSSTRSGPSWPRDVAVFAGDIVPAKKPAPDIYLLAVERARPPTRPGRAGGRGLPQRVAGGRPAPGWPAWSPSAATPRTRTSPRPSSSSVRSATPASRRRCSPTGARARPATTRLDDLDACLGAR